MIGVGGTTLHYQGESHRIHPTSFKTKSKFGKGYDWPIEYKDLDPYYSEAEKIIGVAGPKSIPGRSGKYDIYKVTAIKKVDINKIKASLKQNIKSLRKRGAIYNYVDNLIKSDEYNVTVLEGDLKG